ncbi:MAG: ATP-binding cassette domain-containing protein [Planctomycetota bacterium]|nr:ATP-binding cassette domain-containing protein [Planctomycetota bacterium]
MLGLSDRAKHRPAELSGGEQQRVAVARAIANTPKLLFAGEPTGNLDSQNAKQVMDLLQQARAASNATLVLVTHDAELAERYTDQILMMDDGRVEDQVHA